MDKAPDFLHIIEIIVHNEPKFSKLSFSEKSKIFPKILTKAKGLTSGKSSSKELTYKSFLSDLSKEILSLLQYKENKLDDTIEFEEIINKFLDVKNFNYISNEANPSIKPSLSFDFCDYTALTQYLTFIDKILEDDKDSAEIICNNGNISLPIIILLKKIIRFRSKIDCALVKSYINIILRNLMNSLDNLMSEKGLLCVVDMIKENTLSEFFGLFELNDEIWIKEKLLFTIEKIGRISAKHTINKSLLKYFDENICLDVIWNSILANPIINLFEIINETKKVLVISGLFTNIKIIKINTIQQLLENIRQCIENFVCESDQNKFEEKKAKIPIIIKELTELSLNPLKVQILTDQATKYVLYKNPADTAKELAKLLLTSENKSNNSMFMSYQNLCFYKPLIDCINTANDTLIKRLFLQNLISHMHEMILFAPLNYMMLRIALNINHNIIRLLTIDDPLLFDGILGLLNYLISIMDFTDDEVLNLLLALEKVDNPKHYFKVIQLIIKFTQYSVNFHKIMSKANYFSVICAELLKLNQSKKIIHNEEALSNILELMKILLKNNKTNFEIVLTSKTLNELINFLTLNEMKYKSILSSFIYFLINEEITTINSDQFLRQALEFFSDDQTDVILRIELLFIVLKIANQFDLYLKVILLKKHLILKHIENIFKSLLFQVKKYNQDKTYIPKYLNYMNDVLIITDNYIMSMLLANKNSKKYEIFYWNSLHILYNLLIDSDHTTQQIIDQIKPYAFRNIIYQTNNNTKVDFLNSPISQFKPSVEINQTINLLYPSVLSFICEILAKYPKYNDINNFLLMIKTIATANTKVFFQLMNMRFLLIIYTHFKDTFLDFSHPLNNDLLDFFMFWIEYGPMISDEQALSEIIIKAAENTNYHNKFLMIINKLETITNKNMTRFKAIPLNPGAIDTNINKIWIPSVKLCNSQSVSKKSETLTNFTYCVWLKLLNDNNKLIMQTKFSIIKLHYNNDAILDFYLHNDKLYLSVTGEDLKEFPITLTNHFAKKFEIMDHYDKWIHFILTCDFNSALSDDLDIFIYIDGFFFDRVNVVSNKIKTLLKNSSNNNNNHHPQMIIGFQDQELNLNHQNGVEIGMIQLYDKVLTREEINKLHIIAICSRGNCSLLKSHHELNWNLLKIENLMHFPFETQAEQSVSYTTQNQYFEKTWIFDDFNDLFISLVLNFTPKNTKMLQNTDFFSRLIKTIPIKSLTSQEIEIIKSNSITCFVNEANYTDIHTYGILIGMSNQIIPKHLPDLFNSKSDLLTIIEETRFTDKMINLFLRTNKKEIQIGLLGLLIKLQKYSIILSDYWTFQEFFSIIFGYYEEKKQDFNNGLVKLLSEAFHTSFSLKDYSGAGSESRVYYNIISNPKILKILIFETDLLKMQDISALASFLEFLLNEILWEKNCFSSYNIQKMREIGIIQGLLDHLITENFSENLEKKIYDILYGVIRPIFLLDADYKGIDSIIDILSICNIASKRIAQIKLNEKKATDNQNSQNEKESMIKFEEDNRENQSLEDRSFSEHSQSFYIVRQKTFSESINQYLKKFQNLSKIDVSKMQNIQANLLDILIKILEDMINTMEKDNVSTLIIYIMNICYYFYDQKSSINLIKIIFVLIKKLEQFEMTIKESKKENISLSRSNSLNIKKTIQTPQEIFMNDLKKYARDFLIFHLKLLRDQRNQLHYQDLLNYYNIIQDNKLIIFNLNYNEENEFLGCFWFHIIPFFFYTEIKIKEQTALFLLNIYTFIPDRIKRVFICPENFEKTLNQFMVHLISSQSIENSNGNFITESFVNFCEQNENIIKKIRKTKLKALWISFCHELKKTISLINLRLNLNDSIIFGENDDNSPLIESNQSTPILKLISRIKVKPLVEDIKLNLEDNIENIKLSLLFEKANPKGKYPKSKDLISFEKIKTDFEYSFKRLSSRLHKIKYNRYQNINKVSKFKKWMNIKTFHDKLIPFNLLANEDDETTSGLFWYLDNHVYLNNCRTKVIIKKDLNITKKSLERSKTQKKKILDDLNNLLKLTSVSKSNEENDEMFSQEHETNNTLILHDDEKKNILYDGLEMIYDNEIEDDFGDFSFQGNRIDRTNEEIDLKDKSTSKYNCLRIKIVDKIESILAIGKTELILYENYQIEDDGTISDITTNHIYDRTKWVLQLKSKESEKCETSRSRKYSSDNGSTYDAPENYFADHKEVRIPYKEIYEVHTRRYLLKNNAIEIYLRNKKSHFLVFNPTLRDEVFLNILNSFICFFNPKARKFKGLTDSHEIQYFATLLQNPFIPSLQEFKISQKNICVYLYDSVTLLRTLQNLWIDGKITNFNYLMLLNTVSGRTFNDLSQYPVLPWIIEKPDEEALNLNDTNIYRDLTKPMGSLTKERAEIAKRTFKETMDDILDLPPYHYGSHYSSPAILMYYYIRLMPFSKYAANLQGGSFDYPDRIFNSFSDTYEKAKTIDYKELAPEFFTTPEFLLNMNEFNFAKMQTNNEVNNIILPDWAIGDPRFFVKKLRKSLESDITSQNINNWIDLIFGYRQRGKKAIDALNVFHVLTYENSINLEEIESPLDGILVQIGEFGQTPKRLFKMEHPTKKKIDTCCALFYKIEYLKLSNLFFKIDLKQSFIDQKFRINTLKIAGEYALYSAAFATGLSSYGKFYTPSTQTNQSDILKNDNICYSSCNFFLLGQKNKKTLGINPLYNTWHHISNSIEGLKCNHFEGLPEISKVHYDDFGSYLIVGTEFGSIKICLIKERYSKKVAEKSKKEEDGISLKIANKKTPKALVEDRVDRKLRKNILINTISSKIELQNIISEKWTKKTEESILRSLVLSDKEIDIHAIEKLNEYFKKARKNDQIADDRKKFLEKFVKFYQNTKNDSLQKLKKTLQKKTSKRISIEILKIIPNVHNYKITAIALCRPYEIMVTGDEQGICRLWDFRKFEPNRILYTYHYVNYDLYAKSLEYDQKAKLLDQYKIITPREKIKKISICEENGDFVVISKNYLSIYSINGTLLASIFRKQAKVAQFSSALILSNRYRFEDNYIITGHKNGDICFWILDHNPQNKQYFDGTSKNIYTEFYNDNLTKNSKLNKIILPYNLKLIYENTSLYKSKDIPSKKDTNLVNINKKVTQLVLSLDQRRLLFTTKAGEIYSLELSQDSIIKPSASTIGKPCSTCQLARGVLDKKFLCPICQQVLCPNCAKAEIFVGEVSLRKKSKVCEKCYLIHSQKTNYLLYDNYN